MTSASKGMDGIKQRIETYWNGRADKYDQQFGHGIFSDDEKRAWLRALEINIRQPKGSKVLDVGCGTGFLSILLAELGFEVTGVDFSDEMLGEARKKAMSKDLCITLLRGDAESPSVSRKGFRAIISRHLLWTLPDPEKAVLNWKNLLPPGGQVIVIDGIWNARTPYAKFMYFLSSAVMRAKGKKESKEWEKEYMQNPGDLPFMGGAEPDKVVKLFKKTGLEQVWVDNLAEVLRCEKKVAPLEHSLRYTLGRTRYLVSGFVPSGRKLQ